MSIWLDYKMSAEKRLAVKLKKIPKFRDLLYSSKKCNPSPESVGHFCKTCSREKTKVLFTNTSLSL